MAVRPRSTTHPRGVLCSKKLVVWVVDPAHFGITLPLVGAFILLTCFIGLTHCQAGTPTVQTASQLALTPQQRLQLIHSFRQEYSNRLTHSLLERAAIELGLHERSDMIASSAGLVFYHTDTITDIYPIKLKNWYYWMYTQNMYFHRIYEHVERTYQLSRK